MLWTGSTVILGLEMFRSGFKGFSAGRTDRNAERAMKETPVGA